MTTTLITGANSGLGFETARALAVRGHDLIITSRSLASAQEAAQRIRAETKTAVVHPLVLDLNSFAAIRDFAARSTAIFPVLDVALFNAGVMIPPYALTGDGFETQFQANYLGHFALYQLLRDVSTCGRRAEGDQRFFAFQRTGNLRHSRLFCDHGAGERGRL